MAPFKRGNKWCATAYVGGKKIWVGSFDTEDEATLAWIEAKRDPIRTRSETVAEFVERYPTAYNRSTKDGSPRWSDLTARNLASALRPLAKHYGSMRLSEFGSLTAGDLREWAASQPTTYVQRARTMLNDALSDGLIARNPLTGIRLEHSRGRRDIDVLGAEEIEALCAEAEASYDEFGPTFAAMIATAAYTCVRPGELFALRRSDVDVKAGEIDVMLSFNDVEVKRPKNGKPRPGLVLPPPAATRIAAMPRKLRDHMCPRCWGEAASCIVCEGEGRVRWLFESPKGGLMRKSGLRYYWHPLRLKIGRPKMDWYDLRHAGATLLLDRGVDVEDVAWQLGHVDGGTLVRDLYGEPHRSAAGRRERIRRAFGENVKPLREVDDAEEATG